MKKIPVAVVVAVVVASGVAGGWYAHDEAPAHASVQHGRSAGPGTAAAPASAGGAVHKCVAEGRTLYTDQPCPAGSRATAASGGSLTVVPFPKVQ